SLPQAPLAATPPAIPVGVPSELLQRRPDIAGAERRVAAANAQIGVAVAAFFPSVTLGVSGGLESGSVSEWFTWPSRVWSVGRSRTRSSSRRSAAAGLPTISLRPASFSGRSSRYETTQRVPARRPKARESSRGRRRPGPGQRADAPQGRALAYRFAGHISTVIHN